MQHAPPSPQAKWPHAKPDALDEIESRALRLMRDGDDAALRRFSEEIASQDTLPVAAPDTARKSTFEVRALLGIGLSASAPPLRGGYSLDEDPKTGAPRVRATFAEALAARVDANRVRTIFPDVWLVDHAVWEAIDDPAEAARLWLSSPGRRLMHDALFLRSLPNSESAFGADGSRERIHRAVGVLGVPPPSDRARFEAYCASRASRWRALYLTVPGAAAEAWEPPFGEVAEAFEALELGAEGSPASLRGVALGWLLRRMRSAPSYRVGEIVRDLREELPARIEEALARNEATTESRRDDQLPRPGRASDDLEFVALQHAVHLQRSDTERGAVFRTWAVARWLAAVLWRSPFFGGDEPALAARMRALLPSVPSGAATDPLDPALFDRERGLDPAEVSLVAAAFAVPFDPEAVAAPAPLARALRVVAGRPHLRAFEEVAERNRLSGGGELSPVGEFVAPPLAARHWLTRHEIRWLAFVSEDAQRDAIRRFSDAPDRYGWFGLAMLDEGDALGSTAKAEAIAVWTEAPRHRGPPHEWCAFGIGTLPELSDPDALRLADEIAVTEGMWPAYLLEKLAARAESYGRDAIWQKALRGLLTLARDRERPVDARLNAALFAAWRLSSERFVAPEVARELGELASAPPFVRHTGLVRELQRRGILRRQTAGTK